MKQPATPEQIHELEQLIGEKIVRPMRRGTAAKLLKAAAQEESDDPSGAKMERHNFWRQMSYYTTTD